MASTAVAGAAVLSAVAGTAVLFAVLGIHNPGPVTSGVRIIYINHVFFNLYSVYRPQKQRLRSNSPFDM